MEAKNHLNSYKMDDSVLLSNFDAATKLLNRFEFAKMSIRKKIDLFFIDYDLIPLLVAENYLNAMKKDVKLIILYFENNLIIKIFRLN
jgi:replication factor C subunit 1